MLEKLAGIEERYEELYRELVLVGDDYQRAAELGKERSDLEPLVQRIQEYRRTQERYAGAIRLKDEETDPEMMELAQMEIDELEPKLAGLEDEIKSMLLPGDPRDKKNVIIEVRAGAGGDEAALFAADLYRMYIRYAERNNWKVEILSENSIGIGGYKEITSLIKGRGAYSRLEI